MNSSPISALETRYRRVLDDIANGCIEPGRDPREIRLVAVSKKHPVEKVRAMAALGQKDFGENYLQEALQKIHALEDAETGEPGLTWHFIGHIQSRKCRDIAANFSWVHTVESVKVARKLSQHRGDQDNRHPLQVLIQVNIDDESSKSGVQPEEVTELAGEILSLDHIRLRGLMIIPRAETDHTKQRLVFQRCHNLLSALQRQVAPGDGDDQHGASDATGLDQLSMGMSDDMTAAIAEGATMLRIGTALFGERPTT